MYCVQINEGKKDIKQLFYYSKDLAKNKQEELILDYLDSFLYFEEEKIQVGEVKLHILELLLRSLIKKQFKFNHSIENDVDAYYENHKFEVSIFLLSFEDEQI